MLVTNVRKLFSHKLRCLKWKHFTCFSLVPLPHYINNPVMLAFKTSRGVLKFIHINPRAVWEVTLVYNVFLTSCSILSIWWDNNTWTTFILLSHRSVWLWGWVGPVPCRAVPCRAYVLPCPEYRWVSWCWPTCARWVATYIRLSGFLIFTCLSLYHRR